MEKVTIKTEFIKLGQVIKLASLVGQVNGEVATQRGKKIYPGDVVEVEDMGSVMVEGI